GSGNGSPTPPEVGGQESVPELPEVETIRRDLDGEVVGKRIKSVQVKGRRSIRRHRGPAEFRGRLEGHRIVGVSRRGKYLLLGLRFVAGIGNICADEILFAAGLRHDRSSETLSSEEVRRLYRAMVETLADAVRHRGSSLADQQYRDLFGRPGDFQEHHQVYD